MLCVDRATGWDRMPVIKRIWKGGLKTETRGCGNPTLLSVKWNWQLEGKNLEFSWCLYLFSDNVCWIELHLWQLHQCVPSGSTCVLLQLQKPGVCWAWNWQALEQCHPVSCCCQWLIEKEVFSLTSAGMMTSKCLQMKPLTQLRKPLRCELSAGHPGLWPGGSCSMSLRENKGYRRAGTVLGM